MEAANAMMINALRDRIDDVRSSTDFMATVYEARNDATQATLNEHGNSINAIKAGRLMGVVAVGGGGNNKHCQSQRYRHRTVYNMISAGSKMKRSSSATASARSRTATKLDA